jgi:2-polyprenyl-3-methyl-5-hydroxy-6-metoxy-1,4-benzoquinol methylase
MSCKYGTVEWLEREYQLSEDDPWGLSWRGFERCRYEQTLKVLENAVGKLRKPRKEARILDVGCSSGSFTHLLRGLAGSVTGVDLSATAIQRANARYGDILFQVGSVLDPGLSMETYDVIVCMEVIYYVAPSEQGAFLVAVDHLLAENGVVLISSKVGDSPYFNEEGLVNLATGNFKVDRIVRYGCEPLAKCEGFLFGLWKKAHKARKLLENNNPDLPEGVAALRKLRFAATKYRILGWIVKSLARIIIVSTRMCLRWKLPSLMANWLARKSNLLPTHTLLLLTKNCRASSSTTSCSWKPVANTNKGNTSFPR